MQSDYIAQIYGQEGGELPFFVGKQYGSGWLRTLARVAFPIIRRVANVAGNTARDVIYKEKDFGSALKDNVVHEAGRLLNRQTPINTRREKRKSSAPIPPLLVKKRRNEWKNRTSSI